MKTIQIGLILVSSITFGCGRSTTPKVAASASPTHPASTVSPPAVVPHSSSAHLIFTNQGLADTNGITIYLPGVIHTPGVAGVVDSSPQIVPAATLPLENAGRRDTSLIDDTPPR
jgi:hypothetical protein